MTTRDDILASTFLARQPEPETDPDAKLDLTPAIEAQMKLDEDTTKGMEREAAAQREFCLAHEYIARRIASGSTPVQVLQGVMKAVGFSGGLMIKLDDQAAFCIEMFRILEAGRAAASRRKALHNPTDKLELPKTWASP